MKTPKIVAILNRTPDSFSGDGVISDSKYQITNSNLEKVISKIVKQGADIIDVGAESTAPGSQGIAVEEEMERLKEVFGLVETRLIASLPVEFSIDTINTKTASVAIDAGFTMVNDVSGGRHDPDMFSLIADQGVQYVMMYCKNISGRADLEDNQKDVFQNILSFFDQRIEAALKAGIKKEQLILDPGMGAFISAKAEDSIEVLKRIPELKKRYSLPIYIGASRKGFLAKLTEHDFGSQQRKGSSLAAALVAVEKGVDFIRVHDVLETRQILDVYPRISAM